MSDYVYFCFSFFLSHTLFLGLRNEIIEIQTNTQTSLLCLFGNNLTNFYWKYCK